MGNFDFKASPLYGVVTIQRKPRGDSRGYFERLFCTSEYADLLEGKPLVHINHSKTNEAGIVRGLHFQLPPHAETKIVLCSHGAILDVVVDIRQGSPTYLQWFSEELTEENGKILFVPEGFAHGFQALEPKSEIIYFNTAAYCSSHERGLNPLDPSIGIKWSLPPHGISDRDLAHPPISLGFQGIKLP